MQRCRHCDKEFHPRQSGQRFCSKRCAYDVGIGRRITNEHGYVLLRVPRGTLGTLTGKPQWILEHRHVVQQHLGRKLESWESVHHINGDRGDNRFENLQIRRERHGKHQAFRCRDCGSQNIEAVQLAD